MQLVCNAFATSWNMYIFYSQLWGVWHHYSYIKWTNLCTMTNFFVAFNLPILELHSPYWPNFHPLLGWKQEVGLREWGVWPTWTWIAMFTELTMYWHVQENFSHYRNDFPLHLKLSSIPLVKINAIVFWGCRGQLCYCQKTAFHTLRLSQENVKLIGVRHESTKFGSSGRCEHSFFTPYSYLEENDRDVLI